MRTDEQPRNLTEEQEEAQINAAFQEVLTIYLASKHRKKVEIIERAFNFARNAHKGVRRRSGEPYIMHPIAVARIVCEEIGLGSTSICAALLHDVVEDTEYTVEDIRNIFGDKVAQIVEGLTKISDSFFSSQESAQAENYKKLLLTMSEDIRVILIKIADRLHNMRTLSSMAPNKQLKIAGETLYIYAPLAYRLGLNKIKSELENLSFRYEHPEEYAQIEDKLASTKVERDNLYEQFTLPMRRKLDAMGVKYTIKGRIKTPYSIWKKMQNKNLTFEEIYDILAVRIVFEPSSREQEANECFDIYVALSQLYTVHPERTRDWVTHPKTNGYQALHMTLMSRKMEDEKNPAGGNKAVWVEVQIRSQRMDDIAEQGVAAHWKYKDDKRKNTNIDPEAVIDDDELDKWLHNIREILDDPQPNAMDFLDAIKLNLYASEIFVVTPKGDIRTLPQGSTVLDFAFLIHTMVGTHCIGAKVNHRLESPSYRLSSGDQIEVLTSRTQRVNPEWLTFVTTAKARSKIQATLRREERAAQKEGEEKLNAFFEKEDLPLKDLDEGYGLGVITVTAIDAEGNNLAVQPSGFPMTIERATTPKTFTMPGGLPYHGGVRVDVAYLNVYKITVEAIVNGEVTPSVTESLEGETITLTLKPTLNYKVTSLEAVKDEDSGTVTLSTENAYNRYKRTFTMPASDVTVSAEFDQTIQMTESVKSAGSEYYYFGDYPQSAKNGAVSVWSDRSRANGELTYIQGTDDYFYVNLSGTYYKVEPIKWKRLTSNYGGKSLLHASSILLGRRWDDDSNNWANSEIRSWLNEGFINTAFTATARAKIATTTVDNSAASTNTASNSKEWNSGKNQYACANTSDKIFLLSEKEATTSAYGFAEYNVADSARIRYCTDYAKATGAYYSTTAGCVGNASDHRDVYNIYGGVVPALSISF